MSSSKQDKILASIFADPIRASIAWRDVVSLFRALGGEVTQGSGSRVHVALNGVRAVFHEPHPNKEVGKAAVRQVRRFLDEAGIRP